MASSKILTKPEVKAVKAAVRGILGSEILRALEHNSIDLEDTIRFSAVAARCLDERLCRRLSLKDVAVQIRVPQYQLRWIEGGNVKQLKPDALRKYVALLGLEPWFARWGRTSGSLAYRLGISPGVRRRRGREQEMSSKAI